MEFPEVKKWLSGKSKGTKNIYLSALSAYKEFTGLNATQMIDEAEADREKKVRERGIPEQRVKEFKQWLLTTYKQKTRGPRDKPKKRRDKIGISQKLANVYCSAMKSFYSSNGFPIDVKLSKARKKKENFKLIVRSAEISKLLNVATSLRDKAIIKFMYESNQSVSEVCSLNYGDIKECEDGGMEIWQLHLIRKKTNTEYFTEIGEECIEFLKLYFEERKRNGEVFDEFSPVFVKEGRQKFSRGRITPNLIENMLKMLAIKSGLVTKEQMQLADLNPARPHSLRSGGMSVLKLAGASEKWVEFRSGHQLSETDSAYFMARPEECRELFRKHYNTLLVKATTQIDEERIKNLEKMLAEREITVQALAENGKLKVEEFKRLREELDKQRVELQRQKKVIEDLSKVMEDRISKITRQVQEEYFAKLFEETFGSTIAELQEFIKSQRQKKKEQKMTEKKKCEVCGVESTDGFYIGKTGMLDYGFIPLTEMWAKKFGMKVGTLLCAGCFTRKRKKKK